MPFLFLVLILYAPDAHADFLKKDLENHCAAYARAALNNLVEDPGNFHLEIPVRISRLPFWQGWLSNIVSPADSQFYGGYRCHFSIRHKSEIKQASVDLLITNTESYAEHTQWKDIQFIPIEAIHDADRQRTGYLVAKYLEGIDWRKD